VRVISQNPVWICVESGFFLDRFTELSPLGTGAEMGDESLAQCVPWVERLEDKKCLGWFGVLHAWPRLNQSLGAENNPGLTLGFWISPGALKGPAGQARRRNRGTSSADGVATTQRSGNLSDEKNPRNLIWSSLQSGDPVS